MEDSEIYGRRTVLDYDAAWMQQIEQDRGEDDKKANLRRTLVWNWPATGMKTAATTASSSHQPTQASGIRPAVPLTRVSAQTMLHIPSICM